MYKMSGGKTDAGDHNKTLRMLVVAQEVISSYGKILEKCFSKGGSLLFPQSELPFSKDVIKNSMMVAITYCISQKKEDEAYFYSLKVGYGFLSKFISDNVAAAQETQFTNAITETSKYIEQGNMISKDIIMELLEINYPLPEMERSIIECEYLMKEFDTKVDLIRQKISDAV